MHLEPPGERPPRDADETALQVYLLGSVEFEAALSLQRRLAYEVAGERDHAVLLLCEHPPLITVGREGSRAHILCDADELRSRQWPVRWVNRGGGCLLHLPGQLAVYPIVALDRFSLSVRDYLDCLHRVLLAALDDVFIPAATQPDAPGVWVGGRLVGTVGVAVRDWVAYYGAAVNVNPALPPFRLVRCGPDGAIMTSLERERGGPVRPAQVRQCLAERFAAAFGFDRVSYFSEHPALTKKARPDAVASHP